MRLFPIVLDLDDFDAGSVLLPKGACERQVEAALAAVGIYAPRGPETVEWFEDEPNGCDPIAIVHDSRGEPIVHLYTFPVIRKDVTLCEA